jgi:hydroxymethylpyrimidine pyrophosphatase-like HAD family hydrolase
MVAVDGDAPASLEAEYANSPFDEPINLAFTVDELLVGLRVAVARRDWLNVAFAASGALQAIDDVVAGTTSIRGRVAVAARKSSPLAGRLLFAFVNLWRILVPSRRRRWELCRVRQLLMAISVAGAASAEADDAEGGTEALVSSLTSHVDELPFALRSAVARVPSCFRSFDQHPRDLGLLVERFSATHGDKTRPIVVVGVRTSGTYLAPFVAACLQRLGHADVAIISARSGQLLSVDDAATLRRYVKQGAVTMITDDPPSTGYALASVGRLLESYGVDESSVHLLLGLFESPEELPQSLAGYEATLLSFEDWSVHERLSPASVRVAVEDLLHPVTVSDCVTVPFVREGGRSHQSARVAVTLEDRYGLHDLTLLAEGVGLGYFGDHDRAISERLGATPPDVLGIRDGILFREWLPADAVHTPDVREVVDYIERRSSVFREPDDRSLDIAGSQPVWEVASDQISRVYGRFWSFARLLFVDRLVKALLRSQRLAVPDGAMQTQRWFTVDGELRKVDVSVRAFGNLDLQTFDPAYDAVAFAVDHNDDFAAMRREFSERIEPLSNEKWLLYELVRVWDDKRLNVLDQHEAANSQGVALRRYLSNTLVHDLHPSAVGPLVALDVDGVIESEVFGFKAPSPSAVLAVRALVQHGYRPVVVSGRCVDDVRQIVSMFGMTAGVAEYGAALVLPDGTESSLLSDREIGSLGAVRERLDRADGVHVDHRYRYSVRASSIRHHNALGPLRADIVESVMTPDFEVHHGLLQSDIVVSGVNKGRGARKLMEILSDHQFALAVGDTDADVALLECADKRAVPAHATAAAKDAANIVAKRPYQAGLLEIVTAFLGHDASTCELCAPPVLTNEAKAMLALLQTTESTKAAVPVRTIKAMLAARRAVASREVSKR